MLEHQDGKEGLFMAARKKAQQLNKPTSDAAIYARYSSHNQREESIEQQVEECMAFAKANNLNVVEVYADKAISGRTDKRTSFQRMMRDAEKRKFQVVIAYKSNRIARNMLNALQYEAKLDLFGIKTFYAKEEFGNTAAGRFALRTMMNVNQFYSENMSEDIKRGLMDNALQCKVNCFLPLGYVRGSDDKYVIDEAEADIVREIFHKALADVPLADIASDLNGRGIRTKRGALWNKGSFHRMLTNDVYIGVYRYSGVVVEGGVPPIIEREVFEAMQRKLVNKKNPRGRHRENGDYLLTGKLHCGECGAFMVGMSGTGKGGDLHYYYVCQAKRSAAGKCKKTNVRRDWIERRVAELTKDAILHDDVIEWIADNAVSFQQQARRTSEIKLIEQQLSDSRKAHKNIMNAIEAGVFTASTKDRLLELEGEISKLERSLALANAANEPVSRERIVYSLQKFKDGNVESKEYQRRLIDTFVKSVYLWDDRIKIEYYYAGKNSSALFSLDDQSGSFEEEALCSLKLPSSPLQGSQANTDAFIYLTVDGFVLMCRLDFFR